MAEYRVYWWWCFLVLLLHHGIVDSEARLELRAPAGPQDVKPVVLDTAAPFLQPVAADTADYNNGTAIFMTWTGFDCTLGGTLNDTRHSKTRQTNTTIALLLEWAVAQKSGCHTVADVVAAAHAVSDRLTIAGNNSSRVAHLALLTGTQDLNGGDGDEKYGWHLADWGPASLAQYGDLAAATAGSAPITLALLSRVDSLRLRHLLSRTKIWHFSSVDTLGPWNSRYTGDDYRLFRLLLGILLLAATLALIAKLARSGIRVQPHRIKSHAAILLFYIGTAAVLGTTLSATLCPSHTPLGIVVSALARISLLLTLWRGSSGQSVSPTAAVKILAFRLFIVASFLLYVCLSTAGSVAYSSWMEQSGRHRTARNITHAVRYVNLVWSTVTLLVLFSFLGWFRWHLGRVKLLDRGRARALEFTALLVVAMVLVCGDLLLDADSAGVSAWSYTLARAISQGQLERSITSALFLDSSLFLLASAKIVLSFLALVLLSIL